MGECRPGYEESNRAAEFDGTETIPEVMITAPRGFLESIARIPSLLGLRKNLTKPKGQAPEEDIVRVSDDLCATISKDGILTFLK